MILSILKGWQRRVHGWYPYRDANPVRTSTGRVAFAQGPATSLNPYWIKTDGVEMLIS